MSLDKIVSDDLAALAADSRRQLRSVDDSLRALRAARTTADRRTTRDGAADRDAGAAAGSGELALLRFADVFAARVGHAAAGAMALLCTLLVFGALCLGRLQEPRGVSSWLAMPLERNTASIATLIALLAFAARVAAASMAGRWLERRLHDRSMPPERPAQPDAPTHPDGPTQPDGSLADLGRWLRATDTWSIALWVAGIAGVTVLVAVISCVVGREPWTVMWWHRDEFDGIYDDRLRDLAVALPAVLVAALALGRACRRGARWPRALSHAGIAWLGVAIAVAAMLVELTVDAPALTWSNRAAVASSGLRSALAAGCTVAALVMATFVALRRRGRERDDIAADTTAPLPAAGPALLASAAVARARAARIAAGAMAVVWTLALLVIIHNPFGYTDRGGLGTDPDDAWWRWAFEDHLTVFAAIAVLLLAAHRLGSRLADRALRRRLVGLADPGREAVELGRRLSQRLDGWSVALGLAGMIALVLLLAIIHLTAGIDLWVFFEHHGHRVQAVLTTTLHQAILAIPVGFVVAAMLGRRCAREAHSRLRSRWLAALEHRATIPAGLAIGLATAVAWMILDFGVFDVSAAVADQPNLAVRIELTTGITVAVLLVTAGATLQRRRREHDRIGIATSRQRSTG